MHKFTSKEKFKTMALQTKVKANTFSDAKDVSHKLEQGLIVSTAIFAEEKEALKLV
jgi:hypothetical protein